MRLVLSLFVVLAFALPPSAGFGSELCEIDYQVRLRSGDDGEDTGTTSRSFTTCTRSLTYCHTHAEALAKNHARNLSLAQEGGPAADADSVVVGRIDTRGTCEEPERD